MKSWSVLPTRSSAVSSPSWPSSYTVAGELVIPFAEVEEPFMVFTDLSAGKSRMDFYGGMDKTFQRGDIGSLGTAFKVVPMTDESVANKMSCFKTDGEEGAPIEAQSILPDLEGFQLLGE